MKRILMTICVICAMIISSAFSASAQSASKKAQTEASARLTFTVESMTEEGRLFEMPDGYSISIKDGKLTTYIPLSCQTEYRLLESGVSNGLVVKDEPVNITAKDKKGVHTLYFSVREGIRTYRFSLSYSDPDFATLFVRGQDVYAEYRGCISISNE